MKVLIVEDDASIANLIKVNLAAAGYECTCALDIMLPEVDGYELLEYVKPMGTPVIFLTAKGGVEERIRGLKLGADDYIVKPFQIGELLARVEALLRRCYKGNEKLAFLDVELDLNSRTVTKGGQPVELTVKEFNLLAELIRNKNIALYRDRLYEKVWGEPYMGNTRTLDSHIQRLRRKLGWEDYIKTVFRIGYRLEDGK